MRTVQVVAVLVCAALVCTLGGASQGKRKPAGELPEIKELPNPFTFADGSPVRSALTYASAA